MVRVAAGLTKIVFVAVFLLLASGLPVGVAVDAEPLAGTPSAWAWGANENGRLGDGTTTNRLTPVQVLGPLGAGLLEDVVQLAAGEAHTLALRADGTVWAWGANWHGALGDGTTTDRHTPVQVVGLADVVQVSGGVWHSLALKDDGTVWAWGNNYAGALGDGTTTIRLTPVQVVAPGGTGFLTDVAQVSAGASYSLAVRADGSVWGWGDNWAGQLGDGTTTERLTPGQVTVAGGGALTDADQVSAHGFHSLARAVDGTVWAWGENWAGQLGDGTTTQRLAAAPVQGPDGQGVLQDVATVSAGDSHTLALKLDGTVWAWGSNGAGQLGDGTTTDRLYPVQVVGSGGVGFLTDIVVAENGESTNFALTSDGVAWGWGYNGFGNLGDATTTDRHTPVQPLGIQAVTQVTLGWQHTIAVGEQVLPAAPRDLAATPGAEIGEVDLEWQAPLFTSGGLVEYRVYRASDADGAYDLVASLDPDVLAYTDTGDLLATYHYRITAVNGLGEGEASDSSCSKPFPWLVLGDDGLCWVPGLPA